MTNNNTIADIGITFNEKQDISQIVVYIELHDGSWVDERFYNRVLQQIRKSEPKLQPHTSKMLCGKALWNSLEKGERIKAGKCVAHMVDRRFLPLRFAGFTKSNSRLYQSQ